MMKEICTMYAELSWLTFALQNFNPDVKEKASIYVPAIGKVTIVVLMRNLLRIVQNKPTTDGLEP